jgi:hypothetical protein
MTVHAACCDVVAVGRVSCRAESVPELRRRPGPVPASGLPTTFLKNADEQTLYGLAAVYQAIHDAGMDATGFGRWGVLGAPHKIGRAALSQAVLRYAEEGAWGMSPHLIPNRSLHCLSGAISCALKIHGPNLGVGDGPSDALPAALAMLEDQGVEGVWLVMTTHDPDMAPDRRGQPAVGSVGIGLALALTQPRAGWQGLRLRATFEKPVGPPVARRAPLNLSQLQALLDAPVKEARSAPLQDLGSFGRLELWVSGRLHLPLPHAPPRTPFAAAWETGNRETGEKLVLGRMLTEARR